MTAEQATDVLVERSAYMRIGNLSQEALVGLLACAVFTGFSLFLDGFLTFGNVQLLVRSMAVLGILAVGMAVVVIGRGLDLSQIAVMVIASAWTLHLMNSGVGLLPAVLLGLAFAMVCGAANGALVAIAEIQPVFTTLAAGIFIAGFGRSVLFSAGQHHVPKDDVAITFLGQGSVLGVPAPFLIFALLALIAYLFLSRTTAGRFIYAQGDNFETTRLTGIKVRPLIMFEYTASAAIAFLAGLVYAGSTSTINLTLVSSTLLFDVLMVVVLGGISLVGGRGGIASVIVGTALIAILLNGMVIMNVQEDVKNIVKGLVLLLAIVVDVKLHPRDEETARQGDL